MDITSGNKEQIEKPVAVKTPIPTLEALCSD